ARVCSDPVGYVFLAYGYGAGRRPAKKIVVPQSSIVFEIITLDVSPVCIFHRPDLFRVGNRLSSEETRCEQYRHEGETSDSVHDCNPNSRASGALYPMPFCILSRQGQLSVI